MPALSAGTLLAESETISLVGRGTPRDQPPLAIHRGIAVRTAEMVRPLLGAGEALMCGAWHSTAVCAAS